ncbi:MAG: hypothetical protein A2Y76_01220 [Planctomycetes bacterium RBG_13_60_9]|nr:MAG: hypothetical protein A2Y76_01220 [Planctomycetes bacterium RBG_13_60_9]
MAVVPIIQSYIGKIVKEKKVGANAKSPARSHCASLRGAQRRSHLTSQHGRLLRFARNCLQGSAVERLYDCPGKKVVIWRSPGMFSRVYLRLERGMQVTRWQVDPVSTPGAP